MRETAGSSELRGRRRRIDLPVLALLGLVLAGRLFLAGAEPAALVESNVWSDDAFYYLKIAQNIAVGRGMTFDGSEGTNGFHPLYMAALVPIVALTGEDPEDPIPWAGVFFALVAAGTGYVLHRLTRAIASRRAAHFVLALFAIAPYFILHGSNGLETGVAIFFTVLLAERWVARRRALSGRGGDIRFGIIAGLALLARIDLLILLGAIALHGAGEGVMRRETGKALRRFLVIGASAFLVWLPWGAAGKITAGSFLPHGGRATSAIARNYGWANLPMVWTDRDRADPFFDPAAPPPSFRTDVATKGLFVFLFEQPLLAPLRADHGVVPFSDPTPWAPFGWFRASPPAGTAVLFLVLGAGLFVLRRRSGELSRPFGDVAVIHLALVLGAYSVFAPAHWFFGRYLSSAVLLTTVAAVAAIAPAVGRRGPARLPMLAGLLVLLLQAAALRGVVPILSSDAKPSGFLADARRFDRIVEPGARTGAFQAGIFAWFGGRDVVNLDGKVNPAALRALEAKELHRYLIDEEIRYVMDWEWVFLSLCLRHAPPGSIDVRKIAEAPTPANAALYLVGPPR